MASKAAISGLALGYISVGSILVWSGVENQTIQNTLTSILQGKTPTAGSQTDNLDPLLNQVGGATEASDPSGTAALQAAGGSGLVGDALQGVGHAYSYGGAPGTDGSRPWDCSSFMNYVIGVEGKQAIPGYAAGRYSGSTHGPPTGAWLLWSGVTGIAKTQLAPGDLIVWQTHMGMYVGNGNMVSALNESIGTRVTTIAGGSPGGEIPFYKRLNG